MMTKDFRFGRRMPLPSTLQIRHELKVLSELEAARKKSALHDGLPETASWEDIGLYRAQAESNLRSRLPETAG
jgi:hypothetical protein